MYYVKRIGLKKPSRSKKLILLYVREMRREENRRKEGLGCHVNLLFLGCYHAQEIVHCNWTRQGTGLCIAAVNWL